MGGADIIHLIIILSLKSDAVAVQAKMAVGVNKARIDIFAGNINDLGSLGNLQILADSDDLSSVYKNIPLICLGIYHVVDSAVLNA